MSNCVKICLGPVEHYIGKLKVKFAALDHWKLATRHLPGNLHVAMALCNICNFDNTTTEDTNHWFFAPEIHIEVKLV